MLVKMGLCRAPTATLESISPAFTGPCACPRLAVLYFPVERRRESLSFQSDNHLTRELSKKHSTLSIEVLWQNSGGSAQRVLCQKFEKNLDALEIKRR